MNQQLVPHLFRTEYSKITAVLCRRFGFDKIEVAEDIASETFLAALETWSFNGVPENPTAWLYAVATNKATNFVHRTQVFNNKVSAQIKIDNRNNPSIDLSESNILDSQLRMLFAVCSPVIPAEAQIGLALRILCGFGIDEIADAFLTNKETINKRLFRAKEKLRQEKVELDFPGEMFLQKRLDNVLRTLYLFFNEGYYSATDNAVIREELCNEAMRLTSLLLTHEKTQLPPVYALFALMCFHSSRFKARKNNLGEMILYDDQDESLWDRELISKGAWHLQQSAQGSNLSKYHIEASIAYWHTVKTGATQKWENILKLYDLLVKIDDSPIIHLNRILALSKVQTHAVAIQEAEKLVLTDNHFYHALLGELYSSINHELAIHHFQNAVLLAKTETEKKVLRSRLEALKTQPLNGKATSGF